MESKLHDLIFLLTGSSAPLKVTAALHENDVACGQNTAACVCEYVLKRNLTGSLCTLLFISVNKYCETGTVMQSVAM